MKKVLFALAICGLAFTSCNSTAKKAKKEDVHQHDSHEGHDHGTEGHDHQQEEFKVEADHSKTPDAHEGHDHDHADGEHKH